MSPEERIAHLISEREELRRALAAMVKAYAGSIFGEVDAKLAASREARRLLERS